MKRIPKITQFLSLLFLLILGWTFLLIYKTFWLNHNETVLSKVPQDANLILEVNGSELFRSAVFTVVMEARDPNLTGIINESIKKKRAYKGPSKNIGIDWLNDFVIFQTQLGGHHVAGISAKLASERLLSKNEKNYFDKHSTYAKSGDHLVILRYTNQKVKPSELPKLKALAQRFVEQKGLPSPAVRDKKMFLKAKTDLGFMGKNSIFRSSRINFKEALHGFELKGSLRINPAEADKISKSLQLKPKGFHFHTQIIPENMRDSIQKKLESVGFIYPKFDALSINYFGCEIKNTSYGLKVSPNFQMLVHFEDDVNLLEWYAKSPLLKKNAWGVTLTGFVNGEEVYKVQKVADKTFIITNEGSEVDYVSNSKVLLEMSGDPRNILNLKGDPLFVGFIQMFQLYKTSSQLFNETDKFEMRVIQQSNNEAQIQGQFKFKPNAHPLNEILKFAISNNFINLNN